MSTSVMIGGAFIVVADTPEEIAARKKREEEGAKRVDALIERIGKTCPLGKKIIDNALKNGISIGMEYGMGNSWGSYMPSMKYVSLNATASDAQLLSTIVHECRHSEQTPGNSMQRTVGAAINENRAMEADAMAHECAAVYQMRKAEPETYDLFVKRHGGIMKAYETSFEKDKDESKAKTEAFKAWYDHAEYVELYDHAMVDFMASGALYAGAYKKEISAKDLADNIGYVDAGFFASARATTISEKTATDVTKVERGHIRHVLNFFGKSKIKTSADNFYVRGKDGAVKPPVAQSNAAVAAKIAAAKGR